MGVSIHKFLGYGFNDLKYEGTELIDPRINLDNYRQILDDSAAFTNEKYAAWLAKHSVAGKGWDLDRCHLRDGSDECNSLSDCIAYDPGYGLPNVFVIRPLAEQHWSRRDDIIDYAEETYLISNNAPRAEVLRGGIYPFIGSYMDKRIGKKLNNKIMLWVRAKNDPREGRSELDMLAQDVGFKDHAEAKTNVTPTVPPEVRNIAAFTKLFDADDVWQQLRPILYTYWS